VKKVSLRQCLGCREMKAKPELIRIVKSPQDEVSLDFTGKKPGRGAYLCRDTACLKRAVKAKALSRALGARIPESLMEALQQQIQMECLNESKP